MKQEFEPEDKCCDCHTSFEKTKVGSLEHIKTHEGYRTGYKCIRCASPPPPRLRSELYYIFYQAPIKPKKPKKKSNWLIAWWDDRELRELFYTFNAMKSYAGAYGYKLEHIEKMKRRKREAIQW